MAGTIRNTLPGAAYHSDETWAVDKDRVFYRNWIYVGRAERVSGGYRVSAVKRFCSGAPVGDLLVTSAPTDGGEQGAEVLHFPVPLRAEGVRVRDDWDTLGMRATGSP